MASLQGETVVVSTGRKGSGTRKKVEDNEKAKVDVPGTGVRSSGRVRSKVEASEPALKLVRKSTKKRNPRKRKRGTETAEAKLAESAPGPITEEAPDMKSNIPVIPVEEQVPVLETRMETRVEDDAMALVALTDASDSNLPIPKRAKVKSLNDPSLNRDPDKQSGWGKTAPGAKTGAWLATESDLLYKSIERYCAAQPGLPPGKEGIQQFLSTRQTDAKATTGSWYQISRVLPHRSIQACWRHGRQKFLERKTGLWDDDELEKLKALVETHGHKWRTIGEILNRKECACRDKWRDVSANPKEGPFTPEEDELLKSLVVEHARKSTNGTIPWSIIRERMKNRSHSQLRSRWAHLAPRPEKKRWSFNDDVELVRAIAEYCETGRTSIHFGMLAPDRWTAAEASERWRYLQRFSGKKDPMYAKSTLVETVARVQQYLNAQAVVDVVAKQELQIPVPFPQRVESVAFRSVEEEDQVEVNPAAMWQAPAPAEPLMKTAAEK